MLTGSSLAAKFTHAGTWKPVSVSYSNGKYIGHIVEAFADLPVGPAGLPGIVITGWSFFDNTLPNGTPPVPVQVAVLEQQADGTMRQATTSLLNGASLINGAQTTVTGDFNADGRTDALLLPYNEAPYTLTKGVILQANAKGGFDRIDLANAVIAHDAVLVTLNGTPTVLTTSWQYTPAHPSFVLDGKGGLTYAPQPRIGRVSHAASTAADFDGDGDSEIVFTDVNAAPNAAGEVVTRKSSIMLYQTKGQEITGDSIPLPAPYFNERPQYAGLASAFGTNITHIPAIRVTDFNHDGKPDLVGLASLWPAEYNTLQMLQNTGGLTFADVTDTMNPDFTVKSGLGNYNPQFIDIDNSGIDTILLSGGVYNYTTTGHPNYILLNDGTGRLHVAFHKEFTQISLDVDDFHRGMMARGEAGLANGYEFGLGVFPAKFGNYHQFRPYVTAAGTINYLDVGILYRTLRSGLWDITYSFVNVPVGYDIRTDFTTPVAITNRNGSDRIRTFAGDDTIHRTGGAKVATVDGGLGIDRAVYTGAFADYALAATATGWTLADQRPGAPDGTDQLRQVELLEFADTKIGLGTPGADIVPAGPARLLGGAGQDSFAGSLAQFHGAIIADLASGEALRILGAALSPAMLRLYADPPTPGAALLGIDTDGDGTEEARITLAGHAPFTLLPRIDQQGADSVVTMAAAGPADPPLLWITAAPATEGTAAPGIATLTIHRAGDLSGSSSVLLTLAGTGANPAAASDFAGGTFPGGVVTLGPGQSSLAVGLALHNDAVEEAQETALASITALSGGTIAAGAALLSIQDDDAVATLGIAALDASRAEGSSGSTAFTFTVTRTGHASIAHTAAFAVAGSGANPANAADFGGALPAGTVSFAPGEDSRTVTVSVDGDTAVEANEGFTVILANPSAGAILGTAAAAGTIINDDAQLSVAALAALKAEGQDGSTAFTFTVARTGDTSVAHTATFAVTGSGASPANAADFAGGVLPSGTVSFAPGETSQVVTIGIAGDTSVEVNETFAVTISTPSAGAILGTASATGTIINDDAQLSVAALAALKAEGQDGSTAFTFTVARTGDTSLAHTATFAVTGSGANPANAADFAGGVLPSGTVSFAPGETSRTITVAIAGDTSVEVNEIFAVTLSTPSAGATLGTASATGTIINDDAQLSVAALAASKTEGQSGTTALTFLVSRSGDTTAAHTAAFSVAGSGTNPATASDFAGGALPTGTVSFAPGEVSRTITVAIAGDKAVEANEGFTVTLANPSAGATLGTASATGTIINDDAQLSVAALAALTAEGQDGSTAFTFTVARTGDTSIAQTATFAVTGSGASPANAADFAGGVLPSGTVSFAPGETSRTISVAIAGDTAVEANETFALTLSNPSAGAALGTASATGTISNDDAQLSVATLAASKPEGQSGTTALTFLVSRSGDTTTVHTAAFSVAGSGPRPAAASDFAGGALPSGTVSFAPGETSQVVTIGIAGDATIEADETFTLTLSAPSAGAVLGTASATGTIQSDDFAPNGTLSIARLQASRAEGQAGTTPFTFRVTRTGNTAGQASAKWAATAGGVAGTGAVSASDFALGAFPAGMVSFAAGETAKTITIGIAGNTAAELNESFTVSLSGVSAGAELDTVSATGLIWNDDTPGTGALSIARAGAQKPEGHAGSTAFTFTVSRGGDTSGTASADWAVAGGGVGSTAAANGADFIGGVLPSGRLNFVAGQAQATVTVLAAGDTAIELNDSFTITLSAPQAGVSITTAAATGVITNDDFPPSGMLSIARLQAERGEGMGGVTGFTFVVTRGGTLSGPASAAWAVAAGGATAEDFAGFVLPTGTVSFAPGQASQVITIPVAGDGVAEPDETFTVTLSGVPAGVSLGVATAEGVIRNDDPGGTGSLSIARASAQKPEGHAGTTKFTFTVTRGGDASGMAAADWAVSGGGESGTTAANGADFAGGQLPSGRITLAPGQLQQTVTIDVSGDMAAELNESFTVALSNTPAGVAIGTAAATGIILADDLASTGANQTLNGSEAPDLFLLGGGLDSVFGKGGTDLFRFLPSAVGPAASNTTTLQDFSRATGEVIDLSAIDAIAGTLANDPFSFIGSAPLGGVAGQLRWQDEGALKRVQGDVNGDAVADVTLLIRAATSLDVTWFAL